MYHHVFINDPCIYIHLILLLSQQKINKKKKGAPLQWLGHAWSRMHAWGERHVGILVQHDCKGTSCGKWVQSQPCKVTISVSWQRIRIHLNECKSESNESVYSTLKNYEIVRWWIMLIVYLISCCYMLSHSKNERQSFSRPPTPRIPPFSVSAKWEPSILHQVTMQEKKCHPRILRCSLCEVTESDSISVKLFPSLRILTATYRFLDTAVRHCKICKVVKGVQQDYHGCKVMMPGHDHASASAPQLPVTKVAKFE